MYVLPKNESFVKSLKVWSSTRRLPKFALPKLSTSLLYEKFQLNPPKEKTALLGQIKEKCLVSVKKFVVN